MAISKDEQKQRFDDAVASAVSAQTMLALVTDSATVAVNRFTEVWQRLRAADEVAELESMMSLSTRR